MKWIVLVIFLLPINATAFESVYALLAQEQHKQAYTLAKTLHPTEPEHFALLADLSRSHGDLDDATSVLISATREFPEDVKLHHELGVTHIWAGRVNEAYRAFARAYALDPLYGPAREGYARTAFWRGEFQLARTLVSGLESLDGRNLQGGLASERLNRSEAALAYREALRIDAHSEEANVGMSNIDSLWRLQISGGATMHYLGNAPRLGPTAAIKYRFTKSSSCAADGVALSAPWTVTALTVGCQFELRRKYGFEAGGTFFDFRKSASVNAAFSTRWSERFLTRLSAKYFTSEKGFEFGGEVTHRFGLLAPTLFYAFETIPKSHKIGARLSIGSGTVVPTLSAFYKPGRSQYGSAVQLWWRWNSDWTLQPSFSLESRNQTLQAFATTSLSYAF